MPRTAVLTARPAPPPLQPETLRKRLAALRRRLRLVVAWRGGGWLLTVLFATTAVVILLDWAVHLPGLVRAVYLVGMLGGAGFIAYRYLFLPLREKVDDLTLALRVEERYPHLNDCLASTVQFLEAPAGPGDSPAMRRAAVRQALSRAQGCDFGKVIDSRGVLTAGVCGIASALALAAVVVVLLFQPEPGMLRTAFLRLVNPFGNHPWPTKTQLEIEEYRAKIGRNEPFEVRAALRGVIPETATVTFRFEGKDQIEHQCDVAAGEEPRTGRLNTRLEPNRVQRSFSFQVRANDAVSKWHEVKVLPPPRLVPLAGRPSPQVHLTYPAYTGLKPLQLPDGSGNAEAVAGTVVRLRAAADRPLARAWIEYQPETSHTGLSAFLGSLASRHGPDAVAALAGARELWAPIPAELSEDRQQFNVSFRPWGTGSYVLHFEDEQHLRGSRLLLLNITPDPAPTVTLERPSASRDSLDVLPGASFPLAVVAEDPTFAVRSMWLEYRTHKDDPPRPLPLFDADMGGESLRQPLALLVGGPGAGALPTLRVRLKRVPLDTRMPLKLFKHFDGSPLKEGDVLTLQVCADDFDDVSVDKQPGRSHEVEIRIVARNALDLQLTQDQAKVQQELIRLREQEREAMKKVAEVQARLKQNGKLEAEDVEKLLQAELLQQQIRERVGDQQQGLRAEANRILDSLKNNNLPRSAVQVRMEKVAAELDRLTREDLQQVEPQLTQARKEAESQDQNRKERDRLARLEEQAKEKEKQAQTLERLAEDRDQEAEKAEADARNRDDGDPQKAQSQAAAKQKRQQAEKLRQQARAARKEAEALRQGKANPDALKDALAGAKDHQEEVEKTLSQLLTDLEPFASTMEIKGEAKSILQEQRRLAKETEQLAGREDMLGKKPDELNEQQKAELERLKEEQQRLEQRTHELLQKMDKVALDRKEKDPQTAEELRAALDMARKGDLAGRMRQSREQLGSNNLSGASKEQRQTLDQLEKLVKELEDRREAELDRLAKKLREAEKELQELVDEQEKLQKKAQEAEKIADAKEREEELQRLARKQKELQKKAQEMAERLSRMRLSRAKQTLDQAAEEMKRAGEQMQQGQAGDEQQDDALDRLDEAQRELERAREDTEEELAREQLAKVADLIKRLKERHEGFIAERERIQNELLRQKQWRGLLISLSRLAEAQGETGLAGETASLAEEKLKGAPIFAKTMKKSADAMKGAAEKIIEHRQQVTDGGKAETPAGAEAARLQKEALRRLDQLLEALKEEPGAPLRAQKKKPQGDQQPGGGGGGGGGGGEGDGIPPLAQLKLLRTMQAEINQRTDDFTRQHPDKDKMDDKAKAELKALQRDQQEVAELLEELTRPADEGGKP